MLQEQQEVCSPVSRAPFIDLEGEGQLHKSVGVVWGVEGGDSRKSWQVECVVKACRARPRGRGALAGFLQQIVLGLLFW